MNDATDVDEFVKDCNAVHELAFAMLSDNVLFVPPICEPRVPDDVIEPRTASDEVETFANVLFPEKYGMFPTTAADEVERPANVSVGVAPPDD